MVADDGEVAGGVGRDGDIGSLAGGDVGIDLSGFDMKPCTRSELVSRRITGSPFLSVISLGVNSNFFAVISITFGLSLGAGEIGLRCDGGQRDSACGREKHRSDDLVLE